MEKSAFFVFNPLQKLIENSKGRIIYIFDLTNTHLNLKNGWEEVYSLKGIRKIAPYENTAYESSPPVKITPPQNFSLEKIAPWEITHSEIPFPLIIHTNERKNTITKFFALKKAVQYNTLLIHR